MHSDSILNDLELHAENKDGKWCTLALLKRYLKLQ